MSKDVGMGNPYIAVLNSSYLVCLLFWDAIPTCSFIFTLRAYAQAGLSNWFCPSVVVVV